MKKDPSAMASEENYLYVMGRRQSVAEDEIVAFDDYHATDILILIQARIQCWQNEYKDLGSSQIVSISHQLIDECLEVLPTCQVICDVIEFIDEFAGKEVISRLLANLVVINQLDAVIRAQYRNELAEDAASCTPFQALLIPFNPGSVLLASRDSQFTSEVIDLAVIVRMRDDYQKNISADFLMLSQADNIPIHAFEREIVVLKVDSTEHLSMENDFGFVELKPKFIDDSLFIFSQLTALFSYVKVQNLQPVPAEQSQASFFSYGKSFFYKPDIQLAPDKSVNINSEIIILNRLLPVATALVTSLADNVTNMAIRFENCDKEHITFEDGVDNQSDLYQYFAEIYLLGVIANQVSTAMKQLQQSQTLVLDENLASIVSTCCQKKELMEVSLVSNTYLAMMNADYEISVDEIKSSNYLATVIAIQDRMKEEYDFDLQRSYISGSF